MADPRWLAYSFAAVMMVVTAYSLGRLVLGLRLGRRHSRAVETSHALMGAAMVGMLIPGWNALPNPVWVVIFSGAAAFFTLRAVQGAVAQRRGEGSESHGASHPAIHAVMALAMLYMYWLGMPLASGPSPGRAMMGPPTGAGDPGLTFLLVVVLLASGVWQLDSIGRFAPAAEMAGATVASPGRPGGQRAWSAPRLESGCHIAMCLTMAYMLILMV